MIHLRIVAPEPKAQATLEALERSAAVCNIVHLPGAARRPDGDVILADVAREDTSMVIADLRGLGLEQDGSIALVEIDSHISAHAEAAIRNAKGLPTDAVVWEEVEERTNEQVELSAVFVVFMVVAGLLAAMGIYQNSAILIVGAMVVGPEFGPLAGLCVALVQRHAGLARRSARALVVGFAVDDRDRLRYHAAVQGGRPVRRGLQPGQPQLRQPHQLAGLPHLLRRGLRRAWPGC